MKLKKIAAAVLSLTLVCGAMPFNSAVVSDTAVYAEEEAEYTEGTYGSLTYKNYGDYIEISDCDFEATEVEIPSEIDGVLVIMIGDSAFSSCMNLTSITIPDGVASIGDRAFKDCQNLTSINVPDTVTLIGNQAFSFCKSLVNITIPNGITSIGYNTFAYCLGLTSVTIPDSVTSIGYGAFFRCESLTDITFPKSITSIDGQAFWDCDSLTSVIIPENITSIGNSAFCACTSLTSITVLNPNCEIYNYSGTISNDDYNDSGFFYYGTIYGYENSTAQSYAEKYGRTFVSLGTAPGTTTPTNPGISDNPTTDNILGDTDSDGVINSSDASNVLAAYALIATGGELPFTEAQTKAANVNKDGAVDSSDASSILAYYAYTATGGKDTLEEFLG